MKYLLSILWHRLCYGIHAINSDLAAERMDWDAFALSKGKADEAKRQWQAIRRERLNRKAIAYYQSIMDSKS